MKIDRILISRTDSIGDVMLTLPLCAWLREHYPHAELIYLGKTYTKPVVRCFSCIDQFLDWDELNKRTAEEQVSFLKNLNIDAVIHVFPSKAIAKLTKLAAIPIRIGTAHRIFHWFTCTHRPRFSRKKSPLHEAQLNFELLRPLGCDQIPSLEHIQKYLECFRTKHLERLPNQDSSSNPYIILHPKSQGSAVEWPLKSYFKLALLLVEKGYHIYFCGTQKEGDLFRDIMPKHEHIHDLTGSMTLDEYIGVIRDAVGLVACSTGPLHIAAFTGIKTVGLYSPKRPIHPGRWAALGKQVSILVHDPECPTCAKGKACFCIQEIGVERVASEFRNFK
jgi:heptosyltransferase-3